MAKMKVHEIAKELGIQSKEAIAYLQEKGVEAKAAQSSLEDAAVDLLRKKFSELPVAAAKAAAPAAESAPVTDALAKEKASEAQSALGAKKPVKETAPAGEAVPGKAPAQAKAPAAPGGEGVPRPKKKKTIIFVNNPGNSKMQGGPRNQDRRNNGNVVRSGIISGGKLVQAGDLKPKAPVKPAAPIQPRPMGTAAAAKPAEPQKPVEEKKAIQLESKAGAEISGVVKEAAPSAKPVTAPETSSTAAQKPVEQTAAKAPAAGVGQETRPVSGRNPEGQNRPVQGQQQRRQDTRRPSYGDRGNDRPYGDRNNDRSRGDRSNDRPYGDRNNDRNYGARPNQGNRNGGDRNGQNRNDRPDYRNQNGQNRGTGRDGAKAYPGGGANAGGGRFGNSGNRDSRGAGRTDNRFAGKGAGKGFVQESPAKDAERKRDEEKRRLNQEKNSKRSKKDLIYEEDENGKGKGKNKAGRFIKPEVKPKEAQEEVIKVITLPESLTVKELADKMKMQPAAIIKKLFLQGKVVTLNQDLTFEEAEEIAIDYEIICEKEVKVDVIEELLKEEEENQEDMVTRPPVICVMGHVDHGKTSLLDAIRKTNVTGLEAGGITQHIGAYTVNVNDRIITFLDTPGHEAFTAMRMRGANATDIAVLVVAADDGVMPQTVEAINHAKAAGIEIIVAVNKIDKPNANIDRVKQEMAEYELIPEDWGGSTVFAPVSAKTGEGIPELLDMILLTADILELKANPDRRARGLVIEAQLDKGRGPVATVLVQKGTLKVGDFISAGASHGKVRAMIDDKGKRVKEAGPSTPVEILGLSDVPNAGEVFLSHDDDKTAKSYAETFIAQNKEKKLEETKMKMSLDDLFNQIKEGDLKELPLIVKADVQGSVEAVKQSLMKLSNEEVVVKCIHGGVGAINESDVTLAATSNAIIIGFNVRPDAVAKATAEREGVDIRLYRVIYQAIEDIEAAMKGMLAPVYEEKVIGHAEVRQLFRASAVGNIAGSYVLDGVFERGCKVRISREGKQIFEGNLASLKRFKDDVKEVKAGYECGLVFEGYDQMQELDIVEAYKMVEVPR